ncbi:MAG: acyltransferase [Bacteroidales bacterium]|nr:acyltransferase [Bacteroidales bacterium]
MANQIQFNAGTKPTRQYDIDWLRIILIFSVFLFHIGMIFNSWDWHVKNDQQYKELRYVMAFLHYWRMPLLFFISGVGTYYALGIRSSAQYLKERAKRLVIPLMAGVFILVPVQVYIEKASQFDSLIDFYPHMFEGIYPSGNFSWHHLWFIAYLFVMALFLSPFLSFVRSVRFRNFRTWLEKRVTRKLGLNLILIPLVLSQLILRPFFETDTHALVDDWASFTFSFIFFVSGFVLLSSRIIGEAIKDQRWWYLGESVLATTFMFLAPTLFSEGATTDIAWDYAAMVVSWSCSITAIGFARKHLNIDSSFRKLANEAIYPFYLLHQPIIVVLGYFMVQWNIADGVKVLLITLSSFTLTVAIYWFLVRPFNVTRIIFGMKPKRSKEHAYEERKAILIPTSSIQYPVSSDLVI